MKYTIEAVDDKVIEILEIQGNKFTATCERVWNDDSCFETFKTVGKTLDAQIQEAFEYDEQLASDLERAISDVHFLPSKFSSFVEAWGE